MYMTPEQQLSEFRARIDVIDESITQLLLDRCAIVRQVAALKNTHWPADCHIRPGREGQMHRAIAERFKGTDIPPLVAITIWRQLIAAATNLESPLTVVYGADFHDHAWLAREYFGPLVGLNRANNLEEMLASIRDKQSNIALLPADLSAPCWKMAAQIQSSGLMIFGLAPVVPSNMPAGTQPALALAVLAPEPSGDDISYFLQNNKIITIDGFQNTHVDAVFLGAHPRPLSL